MSKWIKLEELPENFWGDVFVANKFSEVGISTVRKEEGVVKFYMSNDKSWNSFRSDIEYRVMIIEYPNITEGDFK